MPYSHWIEGSRYVYCDGLHTVGPGTLTFTLNKIEPQSPLRPKVVDRSLGRVSEGSSGELYENLIKGSKLC